MTDRPEPGSLFGITATPGPTWKESPPLTPESWAALVAEDNRRRESGFYDQPRVTLIDQRTFNEWVEAGLITPEGVYR